MRRWLLVFLLILLPVQAVLAAADNCCVVTPSGIDHHAPQHAKAFSADQDSRIGTGDAHCSSCLFAHLACLPGAAAVIPAMATASVFWDTAVTPLHSVAGPPPERPNWCAAA